MNLVENKTPQIHNVNASKKRKEEKNQNRKIKTHLIAFLPGQRLLIGHDPRPFKVEGKMREYRQAFGNFGETDLSAGQGERIAGS